MLETPTASNPLTRSHSLEGTLNKSTGLAAAAEKHLELLKEDTDRIESLDRYYVDLAFKYGLDVQTISDRSGIPVEGVRRLLVGV